MSVHCWNFEVRKGKEHSSTKEYYTTYFRRVHIKCLDCGLNDQSNTYHDTDRIDRYVSEWIADHRKAGVVDINYIEDDSI